MYLPREWRWRITLDWEIPNLLDTIRRICKYGLEQGLGISICKPTWPCLIIKVLATRAKFLEPSSYCTVINYCITFLMFSVASKLKVVKYQSSKFKMSKYQSSKSKVQNLKYQTSKLKVVKYQSSKFKMSKYQSSKSKVQNLKYQTSKLKVVKYQSSKFKMSKYQSSKSKVQNLKYQTSKFKVVKYQSSKFKVVKYKSPNQTTLHVNLRDF